MAPYWYPVCARKGENNEMKQIKSWAQYYVDLMTKLGLVRFSMFLATAIIVLAVSIQMG
jgi:two-component system aerobic respiration control sensor histidine kinase ArcB